MASTGVKFGAALNEVPEMSQKPDYVELKRIATECEQLGFDSIWTMDHFIWGDHDAVFECWTVLSALVEATERIRFGPLVSCNSYRHPAVLTKMASTLDVISGGRLEFGLGAGWKKEEYKMYGIPFPRASVRIRQLREGTIIAKKLMTEDRVDFEGEFYSLRNAVNEPKPVQKPHPPIWIGGTGEKLLTVVAELGDWCNFFGSPERCRDRLEVLDRHCDELGRRTDEIGHSVTCDAIIGRDTTEVESKVARFKPERATIEQYLASSVAGTPSQCIDKIQEYLDADTHCLLFSMRTLVEDKEIFAKEVFPSFKN